MMVWDELCATNLVYYHELDFDTTGKSFFVFNGNLVGFSVVGLRSRCACETRIIITAKPIDLNSTLKRAKLE